MSDALVNGHDAEPQPVQLGSKSDDEVSCTSSDAIPPSSNANICKVFPQYEAMTIVQKCRDVINSGPISKDRIRESLNCCTEGNITEQHHISQLD